MVTPEIKLLRDEHYRGLYDLFDAHGWKHMRGWRFNQDLSFVALREGRVIGFVTAWHDGQPYAWVDALAVLPEYQHQGLGSWLCLVMERLLLDRGVKALRAASSNTVVIEGLTKHGFQGEPQMVLDKFYEDTP